MRVLYFFAKEDEKTNCMKFQPKMKTILSHVTCFKGGGVGAERVEQGWLSPSVMERPETLEQPFSKAAGLFKIVV